jgi:hypothetical protein
MSKRCIQIMISNNIYNLQINKYNNTYIREPIEFIM